MRRYLMQYTHKIDNKHASYIDNIDIKKKFFFIVLEGRGGTNFGGWHRKYMYVTTDSILVCACVLDLDIWPYFIYFSAFIIEREDVTSPADKKIHNNHAPF